MTERELLARKRRPARRQPLLGAKSRQRRNLERNERTRAKKAARVQLEAQSKTSREINAQLCELKDLLDGLGVNAQEAPRWLRRSNSALGGRTPLEVIQSGEGEKLITALRANAMGSAAGHT